MKNKIDKFMHNKGFIVVLIIILMTIVSITGTYAWFTWTSNENTNLTMKIGKLADVMFTTGNDITTELNPVFNYYDGEKTTFNINNRNTAGDAATYTVKINITTIAPELINKGVKYTLVKNNKVVAEGDFSNAREGSSIEIFKSFQFQGTSSFELYLYIDANLENNTTMMNKIIEGNITLEAGEAIGNLVEMINYLYNSSSKSVVTNNNTEYNYVPSANLMNDRLGGTTNDYNAGNIRYYGERPDNYIDIGDVYIEDTEIDNFERNSNQLLLLDISTREECYELFDCTNYVEMGYESEAACNEENDLMSELIFHASSKDEVCGVTTVSAGTPKLYRIIGLFKDIELEDGSTKDLVKIIREASIGNYAWDLVSIDESTHVGDFDNNWHDSTLKSILNDSYYNSGITTHKYGNIFSGTFDVSTIDFSRIGLNNNVHSKIASVKWNLGATPQTDLYPGEMYTKERGLLKCNDCTYDTTWTGKIAMMYPSDYGFASDFTTCNSTLNNYDQCINWLYNIFFEWFLTPSTYDINDLTHILSGNVSSGKDNGFSMLPYGFEVRPTFYLNSDVQIIGGDGNRANPYVVR